MQIPENANAAALLATPQVAPAAISGGGALPFDMPSRSTLAASKKTVFAHYFPPFPISMDNAAPASDYYTRNYLRPMGENGKFASQGGLLRDRPLGRAPVGGNYQFADLQTEVRQASAAGLDGFALELLNYSGSNYNRIKMLVDAAEATDPTFKFIITPDMSTAFKTATEEQLLGALKDIAGRTLNGVWRVRPSMYTMGGKLVVNPFLTQNRTPAFWASVKSKFKAQTGMDIMLWAGFSDWRKQNAPYRAVSDGFMSWGEANLMRNNVGPNGVAKNATDAHAVGKKWMQPLHPFDHRPGIHGDSSVGGYYDESRGTEVLQRQWQGAINGGAESVQMITWNDYSETPLAPSVGHGWGPLDVSAYFLARFKTGQYPTITRDAIYLTHREQLSNATPQCAKYTSPNIPCTKRMSIRSGTNAVENRVEVLTFLTKPALVTVRVGGQATVISAPAGVARNYVPLKLGRVSASAWRNDRPVTAVKSPFTVVASPEAQDMQYHMVSSLRDPAVADDSDSPANVKTVLASVRALKATPKKHAIKVKWAAPRGARPKHYLVSCSKGKSKRISAHRTVSKVRGLHKGQRVKVKVVAAYAQGLSAPATTRARSRKH